ncbi:MAG: hypothetical protein ABSG73_15160 [Candidatus Aminicenantales bacterium]|jgi:hypothetical protein
MWPFKKSADSPELNKDEPELSVLPTDASMLPGFKKDSEGRISVEFTEEEKYEIDKCLKQLSKPGGVYIHPEVYNGMVAHALSDYSQKQFSWVTTMLSAGEEVDKEGAANLAINAIMKAYAIYPLPIFLFHLAEYFELIGKRRAAKEVFRFFLSKETEYVPTPLSEMLLRAELISPAEAIDRARREL